MLLLDWPLLGVMALYFVLSKAMQVVTNRLPLFCSLFWPFIAVFGISNTIIGYAIAAQFFWPESTLWQHVGRIAWVFAAALPFQYLAYHNQTKILIKIFKRFEISKKTTGHLIFFHEIFDDETNSDNGSNHLNKPVCGRRYRRNIQSAADRLKSPGNWRLN